MNQEMSSRGLVLRKYDRGLLIVGILFIAINLRPALASVGPLVSSIRMSTGLSNSALGLLTTLPLIAFGVMSTLTSLFTRRYGIARTLAAAMLILTTGILLRTIDSIASLFVGTVLVGVAIAFGNVLLPSLVKGNFEKRSGAMTSMYSSVMGLGAAIGAGVSLPIAYYLESGWRGSLGVWAILSFTAFLIWLPQLRRLPRLPQRGGYFRSMRQLTGSALAWKIAVFMGIQSLTFYVILAWLPDILQSKGYDSVTAGWMLSLSQAMGVVGAVAFPLVAGKKDDQRSAVLFLLVLEAISLIGLMMPSSSHWVFAWISLLGFVLGGSFGLALLFIVLRSSDTDGATELSGMSQSIGYFLAAIGPIVFGLLYDLTNDWNYPLGLLFLLIFVKIYVGLGAASQGTVTR